MRERRSFAQDNADRKTAPDPTGILGFQRNRGISRCGRVSQTCGRRSHWLTQREQGMCTARDNPGTVLEHVVLTLATSWASQRRPGAAVRYIDTHAMAPL